MELKGINVTRHSSWFGVSVLKRPVKIVVGQQDATRAFSDAIDQLRVIQAQREAYKLVR